MKHYIYIPSLEILIEGNYLYKYLHIENLQERQKKVTSDPYMHLVAEAHCWVFVTDDQVLTADACKAFIANPTFDRHSFLYVLDCTTGTKYYSNEDYSVINTIPKLYASLTKY